MSAGVNANGGNYEISVTGLCLNNSEIYGLCEYDMRYLYTMREDACLHAFCRLTEQMD